MIPAKYWSPTKKLMVLGAMAGGKSVEATVTGNPVTFLTDLAKPLKSLLVPFLPIQSGSGDPSPQNIRPIVPWDGLSVYHSGADTSEYTETDIVFPSNVYGGILDVVTGELWATWERINLGSMYWTYQSDSARFFSNSISSAIKAPSNNTVATESIVEIYKAAALTQLTDKTFAVATSGNAFIKDADYDNKDDLVSAITGKYLTYPLASPVLITTLTPQQINAIKGYNTIWSDADGNLEITYLKKG